MDMENLLARASDNLSVRRAFGAAYEKDGLLIIPVAMVAGGGGGAHLAPGSATRPPVPIRSRRRTQHRGNPGARTPAGASADWCCRPVSTW